MLLGRHLVWLVDGDGRGDAPGKAASVSRDTIARFLRDEELKPSTAAAIRSALEDASDHASDPYQ
jgi:hypothetical protein